jgi:hypothetical protein
MAISRPKVEIKKAGKEDIPRLDWKELDRFTKEKMKDPKFVDALKSHYKTLTGKDLDIE